MNVTRFLEDLSARGIRITPNGDKLSVSAPDGALTDAIKDSIRARRAEILQFFREYEEEQYRRNVRIQRVDRREPIPASYAQQRLWLVEQTATELPVYNMYFATELHGDLDEESLRGAADDLVRRHEILRTALTETPQGLFQTIREDCPAVFETHRADSPEEHDRLLFNVVSTRFDLAVAPLIRFDLLRTGDRRWTFVVTQHHVVSDGWSTGLIKKELSELYAARVAGRSPQLPELLVQYADYAVWEREWLGSDLARRQREYWRTTLAELPPLLELVPSRQRQAVQSYRGSALTFQYDRQFLGKVRTLCDETGTTLYSTFMAAYSLLLSRMTRQGDIAVGSPLANRPYPALENTLGLFFNSITVRTRIDEGLTVRDYLALSRNGAFEAFTHQDLPFDQVVQASAPERSSSHSPIFQTIFILQTYPGEQFQLPGVRAEAAPTPYYSAQYDLMLKLREDDDGLQGLLIYNDTLLDEGEALRFVSWFRHLVELMCEKPDAPLSDLALIDPDSSRSIPLWNAGTAASVPARRVEEYILGRLLQDPEAAAVTFRGTSMSRGELARRAESMAAGLLAAGLRPGSRVGVMVPRSPDLIAVLVGILRAGLVYVPLDGAAPDGRTTAMLDSAECVALVTGEVYEGKCPEFTGTRLMASDLLRTPGPAPLPGEDAAHAAYVIFTSGSTGRPKGVEVSHANVMNLFTALDAVASPPAPAVWLAVTQVTFDIAVVELLWTFARGVPVVLAENSETLRHAGAQAEPEPVSIPDLIAREGVTALQTTPTLLRGVLRLPGAEAALSGLQLLMVGGEQLDLTLARQLKDLGIPRVLNMYGPTETTVWSTCWEVPRDADAVLVGRPLANTAAHVVDAELNPVPVGMFGELVLGGAGVARGYVGKPDLTAERFPTLPALHSDGPVYRTGDIARWLPSGDIELIGRVDNQVKVNGYRIELEEIDHALNSIPGVAQSAVTVQRHKERNLLVAHYVPEPGAVLDDAYLRAGLAEFLPDQMVPSAFATATALPTTSSGKTDRNALPRVQIDTRRETAAEPVSDLESRLLTVWRSVLGDDGLGPSDDFFQSGGSSILVARLLTEVRAQVNEGARIVDLFRYPSVRAYAAHLSGTAQAASLSQSRPQIAEARRAAQQRRRQQVSRKQQLRAAESRPAAD